MASSANKRPDDRIVGIHGGYSAVRADPMQLLLQEGPRERRRE